MLHSVPGAYFWIRPTKARCPWHNPGYILDDKILPIGASMFARIIETRLPAVPCINRNRKEAVTSLHDLSARRPDGGFRARQFSRPEVLEDVLAISRVSRTSRRCTHSTPKARAPRQGHRPNAGTRVEPTACSDGVPVTIKDNIATKGVPGARRRHHQLVPAAADAPPAARLREAGAVIFSKTTMPDYGMLVVGPLELPSPHPHPWDLSKNPGGSSSGRRRGCCRLRPVHLGTDIGGSVRLPACWCGLVALKPSLGRIPVDPPYVGRVRTDDRIVDDAALDDERAVAARSPRRHEPTAKRHQLEGGSINPYANCASG